MDKAIDEKIQQIENKLNENAEQRKKLLAKKKRLLEIKSAQEKNEKEKLLINMGMKIQELGFKDTEELEQFLKDKIG